MGGFVFFLSGLLISNFGLSATGALIFLRGIGSELVKKHLENAGLSEAQSSLPGMLTAAVMNWPAFYTAENINEKLAFGLAALAMTLKFLQYFPELQKGKYSSSIYVKNIILKLSLAIERLNKSFLDGLNKYAGFTVLISFFLYGREAFLNKNWLSLLGCLFLLYGGMLLALKTHVEITYKKHLES